MRYEFINEEEFLVIKASGWASPNERLLTKRFLISHLQKSKPKVIVDMSGLKGRGGPYVLGILNMIRMEVHIMGGKIRFCALTPNILHFFRENRLDDVFEIERTVIQAQQSLRKGSDENKNGRGSTGDLSSARRIQREP